MIDFKKKLNKQSIAKKVDPIEIYSNLDRSSTTGPLREAQEVILKTWFNERRDSKDIIIKLHTGEGKTLVGLLILVSKLNQEDGPALYLCPNRNLVDQAAEDAEKFGIPYCIINEIERDLPIDFIDGKKILITTVQKLFNGRSVFGLDKNYIPLGSIVLDDAHACIECIKSAFTARINKENLLYNKLLDFFEADLRAQGEGSFLDIKEGRYASEIILVPYWACIDKKTELLSLLAQHSEEKELKFVWPIIKNNIDECQIFISSSCLEIQPYRIPVTKLGSFTQAKQRILMSATTQDDSFFIKGFDFDIDSVKNPLRYTQKKWLGEKMILIPGLIDDELTKDVVLEEIKKLKLEAGIAIIVPSQRIAEAYGQCGCTVATRDNIKSCIEELKYHKSSNPVVFVNRYDGIDLPDSACRILVIDSKPYGNLLCDQYEEQCRISSDIINIKLAQKIEQGLGRSVRGEKDYSVILLLGSDLIKFIKSSTTNKYFSPQTRKQIEIGLDITSSAKDEVSTQSGARSTLTTLITQILRRDEGWKEFYNVEMDQIDPDDNLKIHIYDILQTEKEAEKYHLKNNNPKACDILQQLINQANFDDSEKGWYLQTMARYQYSESKTDSNQLQLAAFNANYQLLKPEQGVNYKKIDGTISVTRNDRIRNYLNKFTNVEVLELTVNEMLSSLTFGVEAEKFEKALFEIGMILGFESQRPDKEIRKGPDNLWGGVEDKYLFFECKSEVDDVNRDITKHEAGQMNSHCGWFDSEYGPNANVKRILVFPNKNLAYQADFTHEVVIMRANKLNALKRAVSGFVKELVNYNKHDITDSKIQELLNTHKLDMENLFSQYTEPYFHRSPSKP